MAEWLRCSNLDGTRRTQNSFVATTYIVSQSARELKQTNQAYKIVLKIRLEYILSVNNKIRTTDSSTVCRSSIIV